MRACALLTVGGDGITSQNDLRHENFLRIEQRRDCRRAGATGGDRLVRGEQIERRLIEPKDTRRIGPHQRTPSERHDDNVGAVPLEHARAPLARPSQHAVTAKQTQREAR